jgi:hypothetical protein
MGAAMKRISDILTDEDMKQIEQLDKDDKDGKKVAAFIVSRVPNFETILTEEMTKALNPEDKSSPGSP